MLSDILSGKENTQNILIKDNCQADGIQLLKCILTSLSLRVEKIHLFLLEKLAQSMRDLPEHTVNRLSVHNITKDPLGWDGNTTVTMDTNIVEYISKYMSSRRHKKVAMVFDSVSNLILHRGAAYTCQVIQKCARLQNSLGIEVCPVVTIIHPGLHDSTSVNMLEHTATCVLHLHPPLLDGYHGNCDILLKKLSGKVIRQRVEYKLKKSCELDEVEEIRDSLAGAQAMADTGVDPAANLTFNLTLSEREKEARSKVILPYLHKPQRPDPSVLTGSGKIFYQPDEADDFDEEDPDDDLDI